MAKEWKITAKKSIIEKVYEKPFTIVDECKFLIDEEGMHIKAVDPAHVCMSMLDVPPKFFGEWELDNGNVGIELGINMTKLDKYMDIYRADEEITISLVDGTGLKIEGDNITHNMGLVDTAGMTDPSMPELNLPATVILRAKHYIQGMKGAGSISNHVGITVSADKISFFSQEDEDSFSLTVEKSDLISIDIDEGHEGDIRSLFVLDYATDIAKCFDSNTKLVMEYGRDYPVVMNYSFINDDDENDEKATGKFLLAPRIESA